MAPGYNTLVTPIYSALKHQELLLILHLWENIVSGSFLTRTSVTFVITILLSQEDIFFTSIEGLTNIGI